MVELPLNSWPMLVGHLQVSLPWGHDVVPGSVQLSWNRGDIRIGADGIAIPCEARLLSVLRVTWWGNCHLIFDLCWLDMFRFVYYEAVMLWGLWVLNTSPVKNFAMAIGWSRSLNPFGGAPQVGPCIELGRCNGRYSVAKSSCWRFPRCGM